MMSSKVGLTVSAVLVLGTQLSGSAHADPPPGKVKLGPPSVSGNGCPPGSVVTVMSPDNRRVSVFFGELLVETGPSNKNPHVTCDLSIPVEVPAGYKATVVGIDYRGYAFVPVGASAEFRSRYFFQGNGEGWRSVELAGGTDESFVKTESIAPGNAHKSKCGQPSNLRAHAQLRAKRGKQKGPDAEEVFLQLDSADLAAGALDLRLDWAPCP